VLVALARVGNDRAFEELVRRRQGAVRGLLRRLSGNAALGDDLAQETFVTAWRSLRRLRDPSAFGAWLKRVAINVWLQHARRDRWLEESIEEYGADLAFEIPAPNVGDRIDLDRMLAKLRVPERLCVVLACMEG
jgi:RNA polymerase sigma-70 factor (ECF subfamily)